MNAIGAIGEGLVELAPMESGDGLAVNYGGDAANVAVMAGLMGARARMAGRVGADSLGHRLLAFWGRSRLDVAAVMRDPDAATGLYLNEPVEGGGHRFTYWRSGSAGSRLAPGDIPDVFFDELAVLVFTGVGLAVSPSSAAAIEGAVERAGAQGARVACVLNHRPALGGDRAQLAELAARSDVLIASAEDAELVFGVSDPVALHGHLGSAVAELVITAGAEPVEAVTAGRRLRQPVPSLRARNAAGAGDAFAGAFLAARVRGLPFDTGVSWGVAAASLSVEREGCAVSYPSADETLALVAHLPPPQQPTEVSA